MMFCDGSIVTFLNLLEQVPLEDLSLEDLFNSSFLTDTHNMTKVTTVVTPSEVSENDEVSCTVAYSIQGQSTAITHTIVTKVAVLTDEGKDSG